MKKTNEETKQNQKKRISFIFYAFKILVKYDNVRFSQNWPNSNPET